MIPSLTIPSLPLKQPRTKRQELYKEYKRILKKNKHLRDKFRNLAWDTAAKFRNNFSGDMCFTRATSELWAFGLAVFGDLFIEMKDGFYNLGDDLAQNHVYCISTIKGKIIEYQYTDEHPDYTAMINIKIIQKEKCGNVIRFLPHEILHLSIKPGIFQYGCSLLESVRLGNFIDIKLINSYKKIFCRGMYELYKSYGNNKIMNFSKLPFTNEVLRLS